MPLVDYSEADIRLRAEIRDFFEKTWPYERQVAALPEQHHVQEHIDLEWERGFWKQLAERGWLGLAIPQHYGGAGGTALQRHIFFDEISYYGAPFPRTAVGTVAPALLRHGSEFLKQTYLPRIAQGEINFCFGYSEPEAGTDLASLRTSAIRDGDDYVVTGQKIYTTRGHRSDYCWLAARTSTEGKKHAGISLFVLDLRSEGVQIEPIWTMEGGRTNTLYLENVRIRADHLVGEENHGWRYLGGALGLERINNFPVGHIRRLLQELVATARRPRPDGSVPAESVQVRDALAEHAADLRALESTIDAAIMSAVQTGDINATSAAQIKVWLTELKQRIAETGMQICGRYVGRFSTLGPGREETGLWEQMWRDSLVHTFGAGTNEVQRDIIATAGLGLVRSR